MIYKLEEKQVKLSADCFVAPNAVLIGSVTVGRGASIWFGVVARGDNEEILIGDESNVQDNCVLHTDIGYELRIGRGVTIGHKAMLHGCEIGDYSLIGINAVLLNGARIGRECIIGANALVPEGMEVPDGSLVLGCPGRIKRAVTAGERATLVEQANGYVENGRRYREHLIAK